MDSIADFFSTHFFWIDNPSVIGRQALAGLSVAMLLFLMTAGMSLIFGVTRVINFAHGVLFMMGAYLAFTVVRSVPQGPGQFVLMLVVAPIGVAILGGLFEVLFLRRIYRSEHAFQLLMTFGLVLILGEFVKIVWGAEDHSVAAPTFLQGSMQMGGIVFPFYRLMIIGAGPVVGGLLWLLLMRTRWGMAVRAATLDRDMVNALGINTKLLFTQVFMLGSGLAGLAGALAAPIVAVGPSLHASVLIDVFIVAVIGGLGTIAGALVAALLVGEASAFGTLAFPAVALVFSFLVMAIVLIVRPWGLMGKPE